MTKHAIVIGIGPSFGLMNDVISAAEDAQRVRNVLAGQDARVPIPDRARWNAFSVIADDPRETHTGSRDHLDYAFVDWMKRMGREDPDRLHLLIYFAGHAAKQPNGEVHLMATGRTVAQRHRTRRGSQGPKGAEPHGDPGLLLRRRPRDRIRPAPRRHGDRRAGALCGLHRG